MTTDYRALCAELAGILAEEYGAETEYENGDLLEGGVLDVLARARAALAQPEPVGPTDEGLLATQDQAVALFSPVHPEAEPLSAVEYARELEIRKARAVLQRWGRPAIATEPRNTND